MSRLVEGNTQFALDLYGRIREKPGNLFFSPTSISVALGMTYAGARGETAAQMAKVLHLPGTQEQLPEAFAELDRSLKSEAEKPGYELCVANRLWGQEGFHFLPEFLGVTRDSYHAELGLVDFKQQTEGARRAINTWVESQTREKIRDLVPANALTPQTRLVLTNAIYFKGAWTKPFAKQSTRDEPFHLSSQQSVNAPLMHKTEGFRFAQAEGLRILALPYGNGDLSSVVLLPDAVDGLPELEKTLNHRTLSGWMDGLKNARVEVTLPRFKLTSDLSLSQLLSGMGMPLAFDQKHADFSGMSTDDDLFISAVLHKAYVDLNEEGTEAAAATGVVMAVRAAIVATPPQVFRADHPFLFLIVDNRTKSILFLGRVVDPRS